MWGDLVARWKPTIFRFLEDHRGLLIVLFCLPASLVFDLVLQLRNWLARYQQGASSESGAEKAHDERVKDVQRQISQWNKSSKNRRKPLCTSRPNWQSLSTTFFQKNECHQISLPLYSILGFNEETRVVRVEPFVTVDQITKYLVPKGYALAVTLEIGDATLGGLAIAVGMTTHSHRVGLYQEAIEAMEVVLSDGSLVRATRDNEHRDLFHCLPWSHGSLAFLVALELKCVPAKPYVHIQYIPVKGRDMYCSMIRELSGVNNKDKETPDFLEATIFNKDDAVIMVGNFADVTSASEWLKVNRISLWYKPWFFRHVESYLNGGGDEYVPLSDYLLRHNRAIFWVVQDMIPFGNNPLFRFFLGWLLPPKPAFLKFTTTPGVREMTFTKQVFQDIVLPICKLEDQLEKCDQLFDTYPILVYPCRIYDHKMGSKGQGQLRAPPKERLCPGTNWAMYNDLGVYGVPGPVKRKENYDAVGTLREMERFTRDVGGYPFLYADTFMSRKEFEEMFDLTLYEDVRKKYKAEGAFPHLYDKIKPEIDVFAVGKKYHKNK